MSIGNVGGSQIQYNTSPTISQAIKDQIKTDENLKMQELPEEKIENNRKNDDYYNMRMSEKNERNQVRMREIDEENTEKKLEQRREQNISQQSSYEGAGSIINYFA